MIEERWTKSKISDIAKHLAIQESRNKDVHVCRCTFHFGTSSRPATKDEIIKNTCKKHLRHHTGKGVKSLRRRITWANGLATR